MHYICESCGFLFFRMEEVEECPSCEKRRVRHITDDEAKRMLLYLEEQKLKQYNIKP